MYLCMSEDADRGRTGEPKNGHSDKHTKDRMQIFGRGKQEISPGGGRTGIGANGELCVSGGTLADPGLQKQGGQFLPF